MPYLLTLDAPTMTVALAGGKGLNLNRMLRAGLPVPPGFVLTTEAYHAFVTANQLGPVIATAMATISGDPPGYDQASAIIRAAFAAGELPPDLLAAIHSGYMLLAPAPVAVRSSATAEDLPDASFAGQQESYLNVRGADAVLAAVRYCWSSLFTPRAMAYRARHGVSAEGLKLAVVVQALVPATVAGVLFTVNPLTGDNGEMLLNASWGLGEAVVSGAVNPDSIVADAATGAIRKYALGDKTLMTARSDQGTETTATPADRRAAPCLDDAQVASLVRLGRNIASLLEGHQDIEWAIVGEAIHILQARPVTATGAGGVPGDDDWPPGLKGQVQRFDLWTQADVGERWPEPVTPFTWATGASLIAFNLKLPFQDLPHLDLARINWARRQFGRVYMNEGALVHAFHYGYGLPAGLIAASLARPDLVDPALDRWRWGTLIRRLPRLMALSLGWERDLKRWAAWFPQIDDWVEAFMTRDLAPLSDTALWQEARVTWQERLLQALAYHGAATSTSLNSYGQMAGLMRRWLGDETLTYDLIAGLSGVIAAEIVPWLWRLTQQLRRLGLDEILLANPPDETLPALRSTSQAAPFLSELDAFLRRHGHRCMTEAEWLHARWWEDPTPVMASLAQYLREGLVLDPAEAEAQQRSKRLATTAAVEARLKAWQRAYFRFGLRRLQRQMLLRDNGQHYAVRLLLPQRRLYAALGARWAERGWLGRAEDFFFLTVAEVESVLVAGNPRAVALDLPAIVAARREAHAYWLTQPAYETLDAAGQPVGAAGDQHGVFSGIAASPGRVTGLARVVAGPAEAGRLQAGEILVTRATDPGWTPLFARLGGLVLEVGGQLSHGAIVAREYGIPAVVNVAEATRRIADGQRLTVDGGTGQVTVAATDGARSGER